MLVVGVSLAFSQAFAATLTSVPMQGGMVMPMIRYRAAEGGLSVMVNPAVPELTPLLVSNPGDGFDPADPWFDYLDPSRQGLSFSRRYGFVMDVATDPIPAGTAIWLRVLSRSPGLGLYQYRSMDPKSWKPIFGTEGSPAALEWNGMMFHPGVTAPPAADTHEATFEAVLVESASGLEVQGSSTGPFTLDWTNGEDGRPTLTVAQMIVVAWPESTTSCVLEASETVTGSDWTTVTNPPVVMNGESVVILDANDTRKFFRVRMEP